jgi:hypothetical protein
MNKIDLTTPSAGIAIVTLLDVLCLLTIICCYIFHPDPALLKFLDGAFTGFNGALLMAVRVSGGPSTPPPPSTPLEGK